jgi:hypothetical protein
MSVLARNECYILQHQRLGFLFFFFFDPTRVMESYLFRFLDHTRRRTTVGRTPLDEWSAHRRDLYLTTRNTYNRQTSMPAVGFEPTVSAGEWPQTHALDRTSTGTSYWPLWRSEILCEIFSYGSASKAAPCLNRLSTLRGHSYKVSMNWMQSFFRT